MTRQELGPFTCKRILPCLLAPIVSGISIYNLSTSNTNNPFIYDPHHRASPRTTHNNGLTTALSNIPTRTLIPRPTTPTRWPSSRPPNRRAQTTPQTLHRKRDFILTPSPPDLFPTARRLWIQ